MSRRNTTDPLARMFLDQYHLHLLAVPREGSAVGDVYVADGGRVSAPGNVAHLLEPSPALPAARNGERLADLSGVVSGAIDADVGIGLLGRFFQALGAGALLDKVRQHFSARRVRSLRFRFSEATRDSVDPIELGARMVSCRPRADHPLVEEGRRYYLVTGVARTPSIDVVAEGSAGTAQELEAGLGGLADVSAKVKVDASRRGELTFRGERPLAFGVELFELVCKGDRLKLRMPEGLVQAAGGRGDDVPLAVPATIGGPESNLFLTVE